MFSSPNHGPFRSKPSFGSGTEYSVHFVSYGAGVKIWSVAPIDFGNLVTMVLALKQLVIMSHALPDAC